MPPVRNPRLAKVHIARKEMGLDDATQKMSKSTGETKKGHSVGLLDTPGEIKKAIMSAQTDCNNEARFDHAGPGVRNLLDLYQVLSGQTKDEIEAKFHGQGYGTLKKGVLEQVMATIEPIQSRYADLTKDPAYLEDILRQGAERARGIAARTLKRVKEAMGFVV